MRKFLKIAVISFAISVVSNLSNTAESNDLIELQIQKTSQENILIKIEKRFLDQTHPLYKNRSKYSKQHSTLPYLPLRLNYKGTDITLKLQSKEYADFKKVANEVNKKSNLSKVRGIKSDLHYFSNNTETTYFYKEPAQKEILILIRCLNKAPICDYQFNDKHFYIEAAVAENLLPQWKDIVSFIKNQLATIQVELVSINFVKLPDIIPVELIFLDNKAAQKLKLNIPRENVVLAFSADDQEVELPLVRDSIPVHPKVSTSSILKDTAILIAYQNPERIKHVVQYSQLDAGGKIIKTGNLFDREGIKQEDAYGLQHYKLKRPSSEQQDIYYKDGKNYEDYKIIRCQPVLCKLSTIDQKNKIWLDITFPRNQLGEWKAIDTAGSQLVRSFLITSM